MKERTVNILLISIASISVWQMLFSLNILDVGISRFLWIISIIFFLYSTFLLLVDFEFESKYFKAILYLFLFYQFVTMVRGFSLSYDSLKTIFREDPIFWPFIIPLFVFFDKRFFNISSLINTLYVFGIFFLILNIFFPTLLVTRVSAEKIIPSFAIGCGFLLMNAKYFSNKKVTISFLVILLSAISYTYLARRSSAFTLYVFIFSSYILHVLYRSKKIVFKLLPFTIGILLFTFFLLDDFSSVITKKMEERLLEDTRSDLFNYFFLEMEGFMVFGKGMNGNYYYPMDESIQDDGIIYEAVTYRNLIENGYLQLLLTGGIVNIILFVLVLLPASINGIFRSSNQFTRSCGVMVLLWLIDMFFYGLPTLSIHYVLVWICVGICYKSTLRNKTDFEIYNKLDKYCLVDKT